MVVLNEPDYTPKPLPEVGKEYHFFDDGKITESRHYIAKVERIVTYEEAKELAVDCKHWDDADGDFYLAIEKLVDVWKEEVAEHYWLFNPQTDYFVECSIPEYDDNNIWFVRTKDGGWFSMNVQNTWQGGRLDVDGEIYKKMCEYCKKV